MKIVAIGDTHGRTKWRQIVEKEPAETYVFIGDYFDTWSPISEDQQLENFLEILKFQETHSERVVVLIGNHDYHYLRVAEETYSGWNSLGQARYRPVLEKAILEGKLQMAFQADGVLYTHAGLTRTWAMRHNVPIDVPEVFADMINTSFRNYPYEFRFFRADTSGCGEHPAQSPIWVRPDSLCLDKVEGIKQVVGHTTVKAMGFANPDQDVVLIDCLGTSGEYLIVNNGEFYPTKL